ncbi:hypothetical protein O3P69_015582, partial [Scylla paramamosain]
LWSSRDLQAPLHRGTAPDRILKLLASAIEWNVNRMTLLPVPVASSAVQARAVFSVSRCPVIINEGLLSCDDFSAN